MRSNVRIAVHCALESCVGAGAKLLFYLVQFAMTNFSSSKYFAFLTGIRKLFLGSGLRLDYLRDSKGGFGDTLQVQQEIAEA